MRLIVAFASVALIATTVVVLSTVAERTTRHTLTAEVEHRLLLEARNLAHISAGALLDDYPELILQPLVNEMARERSELAFVVVLDHRGVIQGHLDSRELGQPFVMPPTLASRPGIGLQSQEQLLADEDMIVAVSPASQGQDQIVGMAVLALHRSHLESLLSRTRRAQMIPGVVMLLAGSVTALLLMSTLLRPIQVLAASLERIGRGDLDTRVELTTRTEFGQLASRINEMVHQLQVGQAEMVQRERLSHEMELAREIQQSLLPDPELELGRFRVRGAQAAASEVGGDFYDVLQLPDGRVGLVIADVAGKGLAGCLATSMLSAYLRAFQGSYLSPLSMLEELDDRLSASLPHGTFLTMIYAILDPESGEFTFASAGHTPLLFYRADSATTEWLDGAGTPLAAVRKKHRRPRREEVQGNLRAGDVLIQFTDGITEAWNADRSAIFGLDRLAETVRDAGAGGSAHLLARLQAALQRWRGEAARSDDETILIVECMAESSDQPSTDWDSGPEATLLHRLDEARERGSLLELDTQLSSLTSISPWLRSCPDMDRLSREELGIVSAALYDACANIVEHGHHERTSRGIELYWIPPRQSVGPHDSSQAICDRRIQDALHVASGRFLIVDHGTPYDPSQWTPQTPSREGRRKQGRGMGLELINTAMWSVSYEPATPAGNITLLHYNPVKHWPMLKEYHV